MVAKPVGKPTRQHVVGEVAVVASDMISRRSGKALAGDTSTMSVNPFLAPIMMGIHAPGSAANMAQLLMMAHLIAGHGTSFADTMHKTLIAFGADRLSSSFRKVHGMAAPQYSSLTHVVDTEEGRVLIRLIASKWTMQLGQAKQINRAYADLIAMRATGQASFSKIVVGIVYGKDADLTDKYDVIRGVSTGANHGTVNVSNDVEVKTGERFWSWLGMDPNAQNWVMEGILQALSSINPASLSTSHNYTHHLKLLSSMKSPISNADWQKLLKDING